MEQLRIREIDPDHPEEVTQDVVLDLFEKLATVRSLHNNDTRKYGRGKPKILEL